MNENEKLEVADAVATETAARVAPEPVAPKKVADNALAASIAKDVTKSSVPLALVIVTGLVLVAIVIWLVVR